jgi:cytochrome P450
MDTVNFMDEELIRDPFTAFSRIRERGPLARCAIPGVEQPVWLVTRYDDVKMVLNDPRFVNDPANVPGAGADNMAAQMLQARGVPPEYNKYLLESILAFDGADHLRLRRLVSRTFTARRVLELRPRVEEITEKLLDRLPEAAENGVVDLLEHFAYPLPIIVICELVGVPEEDHSLWREWSRTLVSSFGPSFAEAVRDLVAYIQELIERRRAEPTGDLVSGLIQAQDEDGDRLSDTEMVAMIMTLVVAGHETTAHLIGNGTAALLTHPDQLALLLSDPALTPRAVHELLRWCGPALAVRMRYATEDVEVGGETVRRGEAVMPSLVAANYDPRMFGDPRRLDITRVPDGRRETHVAFSHGMHYCLGAALARQESEVAFEALLRRFPGLSLAVDGDDLERDLNPGAWRLKALPVKL